MTTQKKFRLKKLIKLYSILAWIMLGFFIAYVILIMSANTIFGHPLGYYFATLPAIILLVIPLFASLFFLMYSSLRRQELIIFRNQIRLYRIRKFARQILELIQAGSIDAAIDIYKKFDLGYDRVLDDYVYGILLGSCRFSGDPALKSIFDKKITKMIETFDPQKVIQ
jgi:hypothetical protein